MEFDKVRRGILLKLLQQMWLVNYKVRYDEVRVNFCSRKYVEHFA